MSDCMLENSLTGCLMAWMLMYFPPVFGLDEGPCFLEVADAVVHVGAGRGGIPFVVERGRGGCSF